jgi:Ni/Co efflux regulator RcnB
MLKMKKILGILLALCFVLSVTAAAASAAPYGKNGPKYNDGKKNYDNHDGKKNYDNHDGKKNYGNHYGKTKHYKKGYWGHKKVRHNPDRHHKSYWYTNERYWFPGFWYWYWY